MIQENHAQNVFTIKNVTDKMEKYFTVEVFEDFVEDEKILIVGYKK